MKILCIGRNYADHATELGNAVPSAQGNPIVFLKPDTALVKDNKPVYYPPFTQDLHFECELVFRVGKKGRYIGEKYALQHIDAVGLGIDLTARDLQAQLKAKGLPWETAKAFDHSAPISAMIPLEGASLPPVGQLRFELYINNELRQQGNAAHMIFSLERIVAYASQYFTLKLGDLIFTGSPAGVGPLKIGDRLTAYLEGQLMLDFEIK